MRRQRPQPSRRNQSWTPAELARLRREYPDRKTALLAAELGKKMSAVYAKASALGLHKSAAFLASPDAYRLNGETGKATRFPPGHRPWNAGLHYVAGGRSAQTRFKPGAASPRWDPDIYCVGALRVNTNGVLDIKIAPGGRSWVAMARYVWESERGPIPRGKLVRTISDDPHDTRIENLRLATRQELMTENTLWNQYPRELAELVHLRGALVRKIRGEEGDERHHGT